MKAIQKEDVLEKAIRTPYYFDIRGILDAMQKDGLIKPDGTLYSSLFLRSRAEGKDCYQTVCDILEHTEELSLDRARFKAVASRMEELESMQKISPVDFQLAYDMLYLKGELDLEPPLTNGELYTLASRAREMDVSSSCCYLHAERVEAVRVLMEFGTEAPRRIEGVPAMDADKMRSFLQSCDMKVFATLIDCVAEENERFYGEDGFDLHSPVYADDLSALNAALTSALEQRPSLSAQISHAAQRTAAQSAEPTLTQNMER